jgi:hypothetical protein
MDHLRRLGNKISISIHPDEDGLTGRECPITSCEGYFKVQFGTGIKQDGVPCHCPYCGHAAGHDHFWTKEQLAYAKSVAVRKITDAVVADLKRLEFEHKPRGAFGIGLSMKLEPGPRPPIRHYREKRLETTLTCDACTLRYAVYGAFAFCPDCGVHNSGQILTMNLDLARKELDLARTQDRELQRHLVEDALENAVSAFDGFGRAVVRSRLSVASHPTAGDAISFQNLAKADARLRDLFGFQLASSVPAEDWGFALVAFQKRHVLAHRMGIVDEAYLRETGDTTAVLGRRIPVDFNEVERALRVVHALGTALLGGLPPLPRP